MVVRRGLPAQLARENRGNPLAGPAIPKWICARGHGSVGTRVLQQPGRGAEYRLGFCTDEHCEPRLHRLRPLGYLPEDQHRLVKGRRLLLYPTGIGEDQAAAAHEPQQVLVVERVSQQDLRYAAELVVDDSLHPGIEMDREY